MSLKLSIILLCGLFAQAIHANQFALSQIVDQATEAGAPKDFIYALKATRRVLESLAQADLNKSETNAIIPIWNAMIRTISNGKGSETVKLIISKIRETMHDRTAHETIINIATMLHHCFTYEVVDKALKFPWREFRKMLYSGGLHVFPKLYIGMWNLALNADTKDKFTILVNSLGDAFVQIENNKAMEDALNDKDIQDRMNDIIQRSASNQMPKAVTMTARGIDNLEEGVVKNEKHDDKSPGYLFSNGGVDIQTVDI